MFDNIFEYIPVFLLIKALRVWNFADKLQGFIYIKYMFVVIDFHYKSSKKNNDKRKH